MWKNIIILHIFTNLKKKKYEVVKSHFYMKCLFIADNNIFNASGFLNKNIYLKSGIASFYYPPWVMFSLNRGTYLYTVVPSYTGY